MAYLNNVLPKEKIPFVLLGSSILLGTLNIRYFYICNIACFLYMQRWPSKQTIRTSLLILVLAMIFYLEESLSTNTGTLFNGLMLVVMSYVSYSIGAKFSSHNRTERSYFFLLLFIVVFVALPHLYITIYDIWENGLLNPERTLSIIDADHQRAVTQRTVELSLALGSSAFFFFKTDDIILKVYKIILILVSVLALLCTLHYVSRTGLVIFGVSLILGFILQGRLSLQSILIIVIVIMIFNEVSNTELFEIYGEREIAGSSISDFGGRTNRWAWAWDYIFSNPLGGRKETYNYAHNFWLDFGKDGGLLAFLLLVMFSLYYLFNALKTKLLCIIPKSISYISIVIAFSFFLALFTEAVHEGCPIFMYCFFIVCGATNTIVKMYHN